MAEAVLEVAIGNLSSFIGKELALFMGFDQDLERLASLLTTIKATLEDAEQKQFSNKAVKDWLQKLKDAALVLDDILDECAYEALEFEYQGVKVQSSFLSSFHPKHVLFRYKIAKKMKRISERLEQIAEERIKFHLSEMVSERRSDVFEWRQTTSLIIQSQVYGREEDTDKIVDLLVCDASHSDDLSVYPVVGLGGLGKTTLAQLIFNDERVKNHYELQIWVCVSEDFSLKRMTKAIIETTSGLGCEYLDLEPLQRRLQDLLQGKRYLLVLDDVWDDEQENWQSLKSILACGAKGASILVTTRLSKVASIMGTIPPHELSELSDDDCWELFKHQAFNPNEAEHPELVIIGKEIVKKCGGVPLAAKALGGLLRFKREEKEWLYVKENNLWSLSHNESSVMSVLRLSYLNLPIKLRQCFAYCAIFPKNEIISKQYLIELWMANGFISSNEILDAEEVGDGVWNELYWRSFFQDIEKGNSGKVTCFKMHDLVHDLAQFVAEEIRCISHDDSVTTLSKRIHHLSNRWRTWNSSEEANSIQFHHVKSLRTYILLLHSYNTTQLFPQVLKCYSLHVLHFMGISNLPSSIGDLKHLRYLNLSGGYFETLPESLCKLWNLQILNLDYCRSLQKLPNSLTCLKSLQQLSLIRCTSLSSLPPYIGKLTSLRRLSTYFVCKENGSPLAELGQLKLKGDLHIRHLGRVRSVKDAKEANMSSKQLNELRLSWDTYEETELQDNVEQILEVLQPPIQQPEALSIEGYKGAYFPQWISSPSLKKLQIKGCSKFNVSAGFQCLKNLWIEKCTDVEGLREALKHMTTLQSLTLFEFPDLESLPDCFGDLVFLHKLHIRNCSKLMCLPTSLSLSGLNFLVIYGCPELEKRCQNETGEDWPKISHIPYLDVCDSFAELLPL